MSGNFEVKKSSKIWNRFFTSRFSQKSLVYQAILYLHEGNFVGEYQSSPQKNREKGAIRTERKTKEITPREKSKIIDKTIPWGVFNQTFFGFDGMASKKLYCLLIRDMREKGMLVDRCFEAKKNGKQVSTDRIVLTKKALEILAGSQDGTIIADAITEIENTWEEQGKKVSLRNGIKTDDFLRIIRYADAQAFFTEIGVDTPYTMLVNKEIDPFVFGPTFLTEQRNSKYGTVHALFHNAMAMTVENRMKMEKPLPRPVRNSECVLYLPTTMCPGSRTFAKEKGKALSFNNSIGLLLDFKHMEVYVVFKFIDRKTLIWNANGISHWLSTVNRALKAMGFRLNQFDEVENALFLCETNGEIQNRLEQFEKLSKPFHHLFPILMKQGGAKQLADMLNVGVDAYITQKARDACEAIPNAAWSVAPTGLSKFTVGGGKAVVTEPIDIALISSAQKLFQNNADAVLINRTQFDDTLWTGKSGSP